MRKVLGSLALSLGLMAGSAQANDVAKMYFGAGFSDGSVEVGNTGDSKSLGTLSLTVGFQLLDFIGVELEAGSASDQVGSIISEPQASYQAALLRLGYRWDRAGVYLLAGQARLDFASEINTANSGNAVGFGVNLFGNDTTALNLHVLRLDGGTFTTATIGFQYYFGGFR